MTTDSPHFEQAFSDDGGKTWEVNWTSNQTKIDGESAKAHEERWEQLAAMPPPDLQGANAWYQQGVAFARLGNCAKAIPSLERGFQQAPLTAAF